MARQMTNLVRFRVGWLTFDFVGTLDDPPRSQLPVVESEHTACTYPATPLNWGYTARLQPFTVTPHALSC